MTDGVGYTMAKVIFQECQGNTLKGSGCGRNLRQHINAIGVILDHPLYPADLAFNPT